MTYRCIESIIRSIRMKYVYIVMIFIMVRGYDPSEFESYLSTHYNYLDEYYYQIWCVRMCKIQNYREKTRYNDDNMLSNKKI